jgi:hypothetical protein
VGTAQENGTALLNALNGITTASATNPYLLKVEPGIYDLGTGTLTMKQFVDVEGSGQRITTISSAGNTVINWLPFAELRLLSVIHTAPFDPSRYAIRAVGNINGLSVFTMTDVTVSSLGNGIEASVNANLPLGFFQTGTITNVTVEVGARAIRSVGSGRIVVRRSKIVSGNVEGARCPTTGNPGSPGNPINPSLVFVDSEVSGFQFFSLRNYGTGGLIPVTVSDGCH